jgi:hypothetical protein
VPCRCPGAKPDAARPLIRLFIDLDDDPQSALRWAIGNALDVVADDQVSDDLIDLAADRRYGTARQMIVLALGKTLYLRQQPFVVDFPACGTTSQMSFPRWSGYLA